MKKKYFLLLLVLALIPVGYCWLVKGPEDKKEAEANDPPLNIKEKYRWEWERLRDPATGRIPDYIYSRSMEYAATLPGAINNIDVKNASLQGQTWQRRGPHNIGGRTRALAIDITDESIMLAGGVSGGMWRSENEGVDWHKVTKANQLHSVSCIRQDNRPGKENIWYYGTGEYFNVYGGLRGDGIFKSIDGGQNWNRLPSTVTNVPNSWEQAFDYVWRIVTDHTVSDKDVVMAAIASGGIYRSENGGDSWTKVLGSFGNTQSWYTDIEITESGVYYATMSQRAFNGDAGTKGIFRSTDGIEWTDITPDFMPKTYNRICVSAAPSDENQVYFVAETPDAGKMTKNSRGDSLWHSLWKYTYLSGDGSGDGGQWEDRSQNVPKPENVRHQFNSQGSYDLLVKVKPDDPDVVFIGGTNLYRSTDGFTSMDNISHIGGYCPFDNCVDIYTYPNQHADQHTLIFQPSNPDIMYSGSDGGVARTDNNMQDTVEWTSLNYGYYTTQFYCVGLDHATPGSDEIIGGLQDNGTMFTNSPELTRDWTVPAGADGFCCAIPNGAEYHYTSNNSSYQPKIKIWKAKLDADGERILRTRIDPIGGQDFIWNTPFELDPNNSNRMYLAGGRLVWRQNDLSLIPEEDTKDSISIGWDSLSNTRLDSSNPSAYRDEMVTAISVSTEPANIVYYGTSYGRVFRLDNAHEGDPEPIEVSGEMFPGGMSNVGCVAIDPTDAQKAITVFTNFSVISLFYTCDGGQSWEPIAGNLEANSTGSGAGPAVQWVEIMPVGDDIVYFAATSTGLYSTSKLDGMNTIWVQEGAEDIGNMMIWHLDSRISDSYLIAGTYGAGVWGTKVTNIPGVAAMPVPIYPANGQSGITDSVQISWTLPENGGAYRLQVADDLEFTNVIYDYDMIIGTSCTVKGLEQGYKNYYWRVMAYGPGGQSDFCTSSMFTTAILPPELIYPEHREKDVPTDLALRWEPVDGATAYHVQVKDNPITSNAMIDTVVQASSLELSGLETSKRHYWMVSSIDEHGEGSFSDDYRFTTADESAVTGAGQRNFILGQNSPNPFARTTTISFTITKPTPVRLQVFDGRGNVVATIIDRRLGPGDYTEVFDGSTLPQGDYYYNIRTDNYNQTRKMVLIR